MKFEIHSSSNGQYFGRIVASKRPGARVVRDVLAAGDVRLVGAGRSGPLMAQGFTG